MYRFAAVGASYAGSYKPNGDFVSDDESGSYFNKAEVQKICPTTCNALTSRIVPSTANDNVIGKAVLDATVEVVGSVFSILEEVKDLNPMVGIAFSIGKTCWTRSWEKQRNPA